MRKLFQEEWHHIRFDSFAEVSSSRIADISFYANFYRTFFDRYKSEAELDPCWVELKGQTMDFLRNHEDFTSEKPVLSVGCGLGLIEKGMIASGFGNIEVTEVSMEPLRWLAPHISPEKIHIGTFPECLPRNRQYHFIYLSNVEYFFPQAQLKLFLEAVRDRLAPPGVCLMLSCAFETIGHRQEIWEKAKEGVKFILDKCGIRKRGQFWGYRRNRQDFLEAMAAAGFDQIADGFLDKKTKWDTYWIQGKILDSVIK